MSSYMLNDLAYLLGLICGRGSLDLTHSNLEIEFPFRLKKLTGTKGDIIQKDKMIIGVDPIINRLADFTGKRVKKINNESHINIYISFDDNNHTWQEIILFFGPNQSFHSFTIPNDFFDAPYSVRVNFLRGFADVAGFITKGNVDQQGRHRVYLEIPNENWIIPIQICQLLQMPDIGIPVQMINWGHPNLRGNKGWAKEHQIKVYAEYFVDIGFTVEYKNSILNEFTVENLSNFSRKKKNFCNPTTKNRIKAKRSHKDEGSDKLPIVIRGKHFNTFWQICCSLGCYKCKGYS